MKVGSLVECVVDFNSVRDEWGYNYPNKGDILTISDMQRHFKFKALTLLYFEELPDFPTGICDKTADGVDNFREIQPPMKIDIEQFQPIAELNEKV